MTGRRYYWPWVNWHKFGPDGPHFQVQQMCSNEMKQLLKLVAARLTAAPTTITPAQKPNQYISIHGENGPSHNYSYWNGNYPLNELGAVPLKPDFSCWEGNIIVAEMTAFQEMPNCYWSLHSLWHLWKLYERQLLQIVTFRIPFKGVNVLAFFSQPPRL